MAADDIVISGFSAYFPQADHLVEFKEKLYAGVDMVTEDDLRWPAGHLGLPSRHGKIRDLSRFDAPFFSTHPKQAELLDPQIRLLLETSYEAIVDAGYDPESLRGRNIGVFVGVSASETSDAMKANIEWAEAYGLLACCHAMFANRISYALDLHGPSMAVDTACSSAMTALHEAVLAIRSGRCEAAIIGGSNLTLEPTMSRSFHRLGMLSQDGRCKVFDSDGSGYVRSETIGAFFLQRACDARRVYAKLINIKSNADGYKAQGITYPSSKIQEELLIDVYNDCGIDPCGVAYIEAHGTGTKVGDIEEMAAVSKVFCGPGRKKPLMVGSVKSNMGHAESASGISSVAKTILAFETGIIAANLHFKEANVKIPCLHDGSIRVVDEHMCFPGGPVGISSFGFGGSNVHAIIEAGEGQHVDSLTREKPELSRLVLFAGRSEYSLKATLDRMETEGPYPDSAYALLSRVGQPSEKRFPWRGFAVVPVDQTGKDVVKVVKQVPVEKRPLWFVFTGMGCQWNAMARQMMHFDVFAHSIQKSHKLLEPYGIYLINEITDSDSLHPTVTSTLVSIAAIQVALVDMLHAVGLRPDGILGHSTGEIGCAYADGCLTAEQTVLCAYWRGRCVDQGSLPKGAMAAVGLSWEEAAKRCPDDVYPACHNAADSVTISGLAEAVASAVEELKSQNIFAREVNSLGIAFHCKHMDSVGPALRSALSEVIQDPKRRSKRWISSSVPEKQWSDAIGMFCSAEYQTNNFLCPVLFQEALQHVPRDAVLVEIAPHCLLQAILRRELGTNASCLGLMKRHVDNVEHFLAALGELHTLGFKLDLSPLYPPVAWPVPRGTPNIAHLVSWDHSQRWNVFSWKDFSTSAVMAEDVIEVNLETNEADKYLRGHLPDGRMLFPAAGYLVLVWKSLAKRIGEEFDQVPVIFEDVSFHRATILPKNGCLRFLVNVMRLTGEFEVGEASTVVATGRVRAAKEGERLVKQDPPFATHEDVNYDLDAADVYKELRLRGYEYEGAFQGILKADVTEPRGKLKWENNWVTFLDTMLHFPVLASPQRTFALPVRIRSCAIDTKAHAEVVGSMTSEGLDVVYDRHQNVCHAGGVIVKGLQSTIAQRRSVEQTPHLEEYRFVPYKDEDTTKEQRYGYVRDYAHMCSDIARRILASLSANDTTTDESKNTCNNLADYETKISNEDISCNRSLLNVLLSASKGKNITCETSHVRSILHNQRQFLNRDILSTALFAEDPLRSFLDIVLENVGSKKVRVIELAGGTNALLVAPWALPWLSLQHTRFKVEYAVAHKYPEHIPPDQVPDGINLVTWNTSTRSVEDLNEADLTIVARGGVDTNQSTNALAKQLSSQCKERSFILISQRTALTEAEIALSSFDGTLFRKYSDDDIVSEFGAQGLLLVGLKSNHLSSLLLFRKHLEGTCAMKHDVVNVKNAQFGWIETLKNKAVEYETKTAGENLWLLAEDVGTNGIIGLTNCLLQETGGRHIRCVFDASTDGTNDISDFSPINPKYAGIFQQDLVMNVYRNGQWGSYRHLSLSAGGPQKTRFAFLSMRTRGDLSSLQWYESPLKYTSFCSRTNNDGLLCYVYYAPLNFRDILLATGKIAPEPLAGKWGFSDCVMGYEFSGRDSDGRRVMAMAPSRGIATVSISDPDFTWEVPESWSLEEASTIPAVYTTAYYALLMRGNMQPGDSVLIHSGSGGVGQACIAIALSMGCTVFTTVGSTEKREFLKRRFPELDDQHFASSRDLSFEAHILSQTKGRAQKQYGSCNSKAVVMTLLQRPEYGGALFVLPGVDLILNSLADDKLQASVRCLADHGCFLEIGKFDLLKNSSLGMSVFARNITFHGIMLDKMLVDINYSATKKRHLFEMVRDGIASGVVRPLDTTVFTKENAEEAFRFMASGKHIGKVVIQIRPEEANRRATPASPLAIEAVPRPCFYNHKSYVIVGGLGGFGLELADWMVSRGCRKLLLTSRSGVRSGYQKLCLHRWRADGVEVLAKNSDVADEGEARSIIDAAASMGPLGGIFNLAMVLRDALLENQTVETFEAACKPKVAGTQLLDQLSRRMCPELDHFVVFSSTSCGFGNAGQTNYGYANSVMERICEQRVADGLPGLAIQWGAVGDVGVVSDTVNEGTNLGGIGLQKIRSCIEVMDKFLSQGHPVVCSYVKADSSSKLYGEQTKDLMRSVTRILGVKDTQRLNPRITLGELGIDSLMSVEVKQTLERDYDLTLSMQEIRELTIARIREISEGGTDASYSSEGTAARNGAYGDEEPAIVRSPLSGILVPDHTIVEMNQAVDNDACVFFLHPIEGHVDALRELASKLPVRAIGLQWTPEVPTDSIQAMAATYMQKIVSLQPEGPYHISGYSFGATVAFEVALQLEISGALVGAIILLDGSPKFVTLYTQDRRSRFGERKQNHETAVLCGFLARYLDLNISELQMQLDQYPSWDTKMEPAIDILLKGAPNTLLTREDVATSMLAFRGFLEAAAFYEPKEKLRGDVLLIRPSKSRKMGLQLPRDYCLSECCRGKVEVSIAQGNHQDFVHGQGAQQCATLIRQQLQQFRSLLEIPSSEE